MCITFQFIEHILQIISLVLPTALFFVSTEVLDLLMGIERVNDLFGAQGCKQAEPGPTQAF